MAIGNLWNRRLKTGPRLQSQLGRVKEVYKEPSDSLIMAKVLKVNFIYNTVDVVTISSSERLVKSSETQGRFSASLPVSFGGSLSNGDTYGKTVPINIGDYVLIGFLDKDKNSPIVINIYKSPTVAYQLAPTDKVSGDPESNGLFDSSFENFTLYPNQTYEWMSGYGTIEKTYNGKTFLKVNSSGSTINDYNYNYEHLSRTFLRGRNINPYNTKSPQVLYQHTGDDTDVVTNTFYDKNGDFRIANISKSLGSRVGFYIDGTEKAGIRYQGYDPEHNSPLAKNSSDISISKGIPTISYKNHVLTFDDDGLLIDGKHISDFNNDEFEKKIEEIEEEIKELNDKIDSLDISAIEEKIQEIADKIEKELLAQIADLTTKVDGFSDRIEDANRQSSSAIELANSVSKTLSDAAGSDSSLQARLDRIDRTILAMQDIIKEVVAARTFNMNGKTYEGVTGDAIVYSSLGKRLDTLEDFVRTDRQRLNDLINKLDIFLSDDFSKGVASYVVTLQAYGDTVMRNGQGSVTIDAKLFKGGFQWTGLVDDGAFVWTRESDDPESDAAWNANHLDGRKSITLTGADFGYSATFKVSVTVQGHIIESK